MHARVDVERLPQNTRGVPLTQLIDCVREMFLRLINLSTQNLSDNDMIRFFIQAEGIDRPISTNIMRVRELTVEKVLSSLMKVLQSKNEIALDSGISVEIITIRVDVGGG